MKKIIALILCLSIIACISACSTPLDQSTATTPSEQSSKISKPLVDNDFITATFTHAQDASSLGVFYVFLKVENKTDSTIVITLEEASVDNETIPLITSGVPQVALPGNSIQSGFIFSMVNLSISSMNEAETATFKIAVRDNDSFGVIYQSDPVTVELH